MLANKSQSDSVFNLSNFAGGGGKYLSTHSTKRDCEQVQQVS